LTPAENRRRIALDRAVPTKGGHLGSPVEQYKQHPPAYSETDPKCFLYMVEDENDLRAKRIPLAATLMPDRQPGRARRRSRARPVW
jgi:hypothetical protein